MTVIFHLHQYSKHTKKSCLKIVKFLLYHISCFLTAESVDCSTVHDSKDSLNSNKTCVFPFNWNGTTHYNCNFNEKEGYWCSTEVDETGGFIEDKWGICSSKCQGKNMLSIVFSLVLYCLILLACIWIIISLCIQNVTFIKVLQ